MTLYQNFAGLSLFFVLSKTLGVMLLPTNLLIVLGVAGALLLVSRFAALGRRLLVVSVVLLAICGFSPLGNILLYPLEQRFPPWDAAQGRARRHHRSRRAGRSRSVGCARHARRQKLADRMIAAAALARRYPNARIVFSGGSANLISNDAKEADYAAEIFESLGIAKSRLIDGAAFAQYRRRMREFSKAIVKPKAGERWLLVTSAFHMPRSIGLFRKAGFAVEPYPVDWRVGGREDLLSFTNFAGDGLVEPIPPCGNGSVSSPIGSPAGPMSCFRGRHGLEGSRARTSRRAFEACRFGS